MRTVNFGGERSVSKFIVLKEEVAEETSVIGDN